MSDIELAEASAEVMGWFITYSPARRGVPGVEVSETEYGKRFVWNPADDFNQAMVFVKWWCEQGNERWWRVATEPGHDVFSAGVFDSETGQSEKFRGTVSPANLLTDAVLQMIGSDAVLQMIEKGK